MRTRVVTRLHRRRLRFSILDIINYLSLTLLGLITGFPFLYVIAGSLTRTGDFRDSGITLNPTRWTLDAYRYLLAPGSTIRQGLKISLAVTCVGTLLSVVTTAALAYGLAREGLPGRRFFTVMILFTMLFERGMAPFFLVVQALGLLDTLASLVLPFLVNAYYLFITVKFFEKLPRDYQDAARLDGCADIGVFVRMALPLSKPVLSTMALFYAIDYWNQWFWPIIFLKSPRLRPLQTVLRGIVASQRVNVTQMAAIVLSALPIIVLVTSLQKHFVKGFAFTGIK